MNGRNAANAREKLRALEAEGANDLSAKLFLVDGALTAARVGARALPERATQRTQRTRCGRGFA